MLSTFSATPAKQSLMLLAEAARTRGTVIRGAPGSGKTVLTALIVYGDLYRGKPALVIDAKGALKRQVLKLILRHSEARRKALLSRLRLWPVGHPMYTYTLPFIYGPGTHDQRAQRFLDLIMKLTPSLADRPIMGKPSLYGVGWPVGMILSALGYQITEAMDLLINVDTKGSLWAPRLAEAQKYVPQAVNLFRRTYLQWAQPVRRDRRYAFESHLYPYLLSDTLCAMSGAAHPLNFAELEQKGITLLVDTSGIQEDLVRDQITLHLFTTFLTWLKRRGVGNLKPWSLVLEEAAILLRTEALVPDIQALANEYRNHRLQPTLSFQSVHQLTQGFQELLYSFGTHWIGRTSSADESDIEADFLLRYAPHLVKFPGYASVDQFGRMTGHNNPMYYSVEEQRRLLADELGSLGGRQFIVRQYVDEATVDPIIHRVTTTVELPDTRHVTDTHVMEVEEENLDHYAQKVRALLTEIDARLVARPQNDKTNVQPKQLA